MKIYVVRFYRPIVVWPSFWIHVHPTHQLELTYTVHCLRIVVEFFCRSRNYLNTSTRLYLQNNLKGVQDGVLNAIFELECTILFCRVGIYFPHSNTSPTDATSHTSRNPVDTSMKHVLKIDITHFHEFRQLLLRPTTPCTQGQAILVTFVRKKFHSNSIFSGTPISWNRHPLMCFYEHYNIKPFKHHF